MANQTSKPAPSAFHSHKPWARRSLYGQIFGLAASAAALVIAPASHAATAVGPLAVTAMVSGACNVLASALAFPGATSAGITAANVDATGNVSVNCTVGSNYTVALDVGTGVGATLATRQMTPASGTQLLGYSVFTTAGRTTVWGDGTAGSATVAGTGTGADQPLVAYGRIFSGQTVPAANYADTVNVTIIY